MHELGVVFQAINIVEEVAKENNLSEIEIKKGDSVNLLFLFYLSGSANTCSIIRRSTSSNTLFRRFITASAVAIN